MNGLMVAIGEELSEEVSILRAVCSPKEVSLRVDDRSFPFLNSGDSSLVVEMVDGEALEGVFNVGLFGMIGETRDLNAFVISSMRGDEFFNLAVIPNVSQKLDVG